MTRKHIISLLAAFPALASCLTAQTLLVEIDLGLPCGTTVDAMGDIDGDGLPDLLVGLEVPGAGQARIISASDGSLIHQLDSAGLGSTFGYPVVATGDLDGDGIRDVLVGAIRAELGGVPRGAVRAYSGSTGAILYTLYGDVSAAVSYFGAAIAGIGDVDADGHEDFAVGVPYSDVVAPRAGLVRVFSGLHGSLLYQVEGSGDSQEQFGTRVAGISDVNADGVDDLIASSRYSFFNAPGAGIARVFSGATGALVYEFLGSATELGLGHEVGPAGDWNADGVEEFYVSSQSPFSMDGILRVHSGIDGSALRVFSSDGLDPITEGLEFVPDQSGDGRPDVWIGDPNYPDSSHLGRCRLVHRSSFQPFLVVEGLGGEGFGYDVASIDDVDGDGLAELVSSNRLGVVRVFSSQSPSPPPAQPRVLLDMAGQRSGDLFGTSVALAGDMDGDGVADFLVGALEGDQFHSQGGSVQVLSGASGAVLGELVHPNSWISTWSFGWSLAGGVDLYGLINNYEDYIVGQPGRSASGNSRGAVLLFDHTLDMFREHLGGAAHDYYGTSVCALPDMDGDGRGEYLIGAPGSDQFPILGYVELHSGQGGGLILTRAGVSIGSGFGHAVADAGDMDGDGVTDLLVGAPYDDGGALDGGMVRVFSGASGAILHSVYGSVAGAQLGYSLDSAGDVNGDGVVDFIAGAPGDFGMTAESGSATIFSGADGSELIRFLGEDLGDKFGVSVAKLGDQDGDGVPDFAIGAPDAEGLYLDCGRIEIRSGRTGEPLFAMFGDSVRDHLGSSLAAAGDRNGDGSMDVLVGAPKGEVGLANTGQVLLLARPSFLNGCQGLPNSTGSPALLTALGSAVVSTNDLSLEVANAAPAQFGLFFFGPDAINLPFGEGRLCVGGGLTRLGPALLTSGSGTVSRDIPLDTSPAAGVLIPGSRFQFQFWYRDPQGGAAGFNLSSAQSVAFE